MLQLAHVSRPGVGAHELRRLVGKRHLAVARLRVALVEEVACEVERVPHAVAQRGQVDGEHGDAVEQVLAELVLAHQLRQVLVRGGHQAEVDLLVRLAAHADDALVLQHAQKRGLQFQRHVADLVEEERPSVGQLDLAGLAAALGAREAAALVAEELAFDEAGRDGGAVDGHEGSLGARLVVDGLGEQLLAGAALARQKDVLARSGEAGGELLRLCYLVAPAQDVLERDVGRISQLASRGAERGALGLLKRDDVALEVVVPAVDARDLGLEGHAVHVEGRVAALLDDLLERTAVVDEGVHVRAEQLLGGRLEDAGGFRGGQRDGVLGIADEDTVLHGVHEVLRDGLVALGLQRRLAVARLGLGELGVVAADAQLVAQGDGER